MEKKDKINICLNLINKMENDNILEEDSTSSSDTDDSSSNDEICVALLKEDPARIHDYAEIVVPSYSDFEFRKHFRLSREAFNYILLKLVSKIDSDRRFRIDLEKQLLTVVRLFATNETYESIGDRFNLAKSTLSLIFVRIINGLNKLAPEVIKWPSETEINISKQKFKERANLDGVIGAIDGMYIRIKCPANQMQSYTNRKMFQSITLQAVCDGKLKYIDCFCGYPSSVHDARIFNGSDLSHKAEEKQLRYFLNGDIILGDKAYPVLPWLIPPYIDRGNLSSLQKRFNGAHASTRQVIERSFGHLFGRFRHLRYLDMNRIDWIPATVIAACVLHNICIKKNDEVEEYISRGMVYAEQNSTTTDESNCNYNSCGNEIRRRLTSNLNI